jgi:hypothetical protein
MTASGSSLLWFHGVERGVRGRGSDGVCVSIFEGGRVARAMRGRWCGDDREIAASVVWRSKITHTGWVARATKVGRALGRLG